MTGGGWWEPCYAGGLLGRGRAVAKAKIGEKLFCRILLSGSFLPIALTPAESRNCLEYKLFLVREPPRNAADIFEKFRNV